jgi:hypothetical protein
MRSLISVITLVLFSFGQAHAQQNYDNANDVLPLCKTWLKVVVETDVSNLFGWWQRRPKNHIFHISLIYEFSHSQGPKPECLLRARMSSSSGCRHSHDQINPLEFAQPMSKPRPTSQSPARLTSEARSDLISTDREDTVRRALTGRRVRGWPPCAPRVLGEAPVAPSPVACCRSRKAVRLGSCGRGLGASRVFPRRNRIAGRSDRSRVSLAISIGYLAVPRELLVRNQIKYMDWQTCPRGDFELQRFFGEVANRLSARAVIPHHELRAGWLSTVQGRAVL